MYNIVKTREILFTTVIKACPFIVDIKANSVSVPVVGLPAGAVRVAAYAPAALPGPGPGPRLRLLLVALPAPGHGTSTSTLTRNLARVVMYFKEMKIVQNAMSVCLDDVCDESCQKFKNLIFICYEVMIMMKHQYYVKIIPSTTAGEP